MKTPIVLLTDFGDRDPFVGIMKGVLLKINSGAPQIDLNHNIPPGDIRRAGITLWQAKPYFPKGTIFLTVIDPGVGSQRKPILAQSRGYTFVGPDNGVFTFVLAEDVRAWELANPALGLPQITNTFHGRDIFAPAAAHASLGIPGPEFGPPVLELVRLPSPKLDYPSAGMLRGEILYADHFGNLLTSLGRFDMLEPNQWALNPWVGDIAPIEFDPKEASLHLPEGKKLSWVDTFNQIPPGEVAALIGSSGLIEIAANGESAAAMLGMKGGEILELSLPPQHE